MFQCENGTMFSMDEVLSIKEATAYCDKNGCKIHPHPVQTYSSEKELIDAIPTIVSHPHDKSLLLGVVDGLGSCIEFLSEGLFCLILFSVVFVFWLILWIICLPFRLLFGTTFPGKCPFPSVMSKEERVREREKMKRKSDEAVLNSCRWHCDNHGYCRDYNYNVHAVKQWDVTLKNQKKKIHIFNSDYERLRAEMGK